MERSCPLLSARRHTARRLPAARGESGVPERPSLTQKAAKTPCGRRDRASVGSLLEPKPLRMALTDKKQLAKMDVRAARCHTQPAVKFLTMLFEIGGLCGR